MNLKNLANHSIEHSCEIVEYSPNVSKLALHYGWGANILVVEANESLLLIDSGYKKTAGFLGKQLSERCNKPVEMIINTHFHGDHIGGNSLIEKGGRMIIHENIKQREFYYSGYDTIKDLFCLDFGEERIEIIPMPYGHSTTDILVWLKKSNVIHAGDLYLSESFPITGSHESLSVYNLLDNLQQLCNMVNLNTVIVSGHGKDTGKKELEQYIAMVESTIKLVEDKIEKGWAKRNIQKADVLRSYDKWGTSIQFITKNSWIENIYRNYMSLKSS